MYCPFSRILVHHNYPCCRDPLLRARHSNFYTAFWTRRARQIMSEQRDNRISRAGFGMLKTREQATDDDVQNILTYWRSLPRCQRQQVSSAPRLTRQAETPHGHVNLCGNHADIWIIRDYYWRATHDKQRYVVPYCTHHWIEYMGLGDDSEARNQAIRQTRTEHKYK